MKDYDKHGYPLDCVRCQTGGILCKYPARSRTTCPKNPATYKPASNVITSKTFVQHYDKLIRGTRTRAGAALRPQRAMQTLNVSLAVAPQRDMNTALSST